VVRRTPFTRLGATLRIGSGLATPTICASSRRITATAAGNAPRRHRVDLAGRIQLTDELSKQAGSDLTRYTADQGA
jgi:hypothetical protein